MEKIKTHISITKETNQIITNEAKKRGMNRSQLIEEAVITYCETHEDSKIEQLTNIVYQCEELQSLVADNSEAVELVQFIEREVIEYGCI